MPASVSIKEKRKKKKEETLLFRVLYGVFICFDRNFKKGERKKEQSVLNILNTSMCFSTSFYESPDGEFISAGKCFEVGKRRKNSVRFAFLAHCVSLILFLKSEAAMKFRISLLMLVWDVSAKPFLYSLPPFTGEVAAKPT